MALAIVFMSALLGQLLVRSIDRTAVDERATTTNHLSSA
jgi:hypothetical protein